MIDLRLGDCQEIIPTLKSKSIDLWFTSPPYALGMAYEPGLDWWELANLMHKTALHALPVTKPSGFFVVNFGETTKYPRTMAELYNAVFTEAGWIMHSRRIWHKNWPLVKFSPSGIQHTIPAAEWEYLWTFRKPPNEKEEKRDTKLSAHGVWEPGGKNACPDHPAAFPIELVEQVLTLWSSPGDLVVDPFMGSGTTGLGCFKLGRDFIGIEINQEYYNLAQAMTDEARYQKTLKEEGL